MNEEETTAEELRELVREAHGVIKDLNREKREVRGLMADLRAVIEEARNAPMEEVSAVIARITSEGAESLAKQISDVANEATELVQNEVFKRFDTLMDVLLGYDQGRRTESIPDMLKNRMQPKIDLEALSGLARPIERPKP